ncbi:hypothetical protein [Shewanella sp.]|uniref:hypothetical protein n=1 Tax=Shewanella sp. TaxID=50422 RepID=UPI00404804F2
MPKPDRKRKRYDSNSSSSSQPMAVDRPRFKSRYRSTVEKKWFDTSISATTLDTTGTILSPSINLVDEGNNANQMAGRKIVVTRVQMRVILNNTSDADSLGNLNSSSIYRLVIALDKQCNGSTPSVLALFLNNNIRTFNNLAQSRRFQILKDETGNFEGMISYNSSVNNPITPNTKKYFEIYLKCFLPIMFEDQAGANRALGEVISNNIFVCGFSDNSNVSATYTCRIRYQDN